MPTSGSQRMPPVVRSMSSEPLYVPRSTARSAASRSWMARMRGSIAANGTAQARRTRIRRRCVVAGSSSRVNSSSLVWPPPAARSASRASASPADARSTRGASSGSWAKSRRTVDTSSWVGTASSRASSSSTVPISGCSTTKAARKMHNWASNSSAMSAASSAGSAGLGLAQPRPVDLGQVVGRARIAGQAEQEVVQRAHVPLDREAARRAGQVADLRTAGGRRDGRAGSDGGAGRGEHDGRCTPNSC